MIYNLQDRIMEDSFFENTDSNSQFGGVTPISLKGATSRCQVVRKHGKRMFMKHIRPELKSNKKYQQAFVKEFEIGFNLEHPNIVRYYELGEDHDGIFMLTEYVEGMTLTELCNADPSHFKKTENIHKFLVQLLDALHYIHSNQVLHLDLKPDNILLTNVGRDLKLIDFGFSYSDEFDTTMGCTDSYASPEQQKKLKKYDSRTDLFAVGCIVKYICEHCATERSSALLSFANKCTKENPDDRFKNAAEAKEWLNRRKSRKKAIISTILTVALLAICVATYFVYHRTLPEEKVEEQSQKGMAVEEDASEQKVISVMDSVFRMVYMPMRILWHTNGVEADCKALSEDELMKRISEVRDFNDKLQSSWEYELIYLTNRFPQHRVLIYKNYKQYTYPAEADSLKKWIDVATKRLGLQERWDEEKLKK